MSSVTARVTIDVHTSMKRTLDGVARANNVTVDAIIEHALAEWFGNRNVEYGFELNPGSVQCFFCSDEFQEGPELKFTAEELENAPERSFPVKLRTSREHYADGGSALSLEALSDRLGGRISASRLSDLEAGKEDARAAEIDLLAEALDVDEFDLRSPHVTAEDCVAGMRRGREIRAFLAERERGSNVIPMRGLA